VKRRKRMLEALDEDIRDFIEMETQDNVEHGMSQEEARYAALRKFGNVTRVKEDTREIWSVTWLEQLLQDIHFGLRMLRKSPGFTAAAAIALALGIGATTAVFSLVNAVLIRPLPYANPRQLVLLWTPYPQLEQSIQQVIGQGNEDFAFEVFGPSPGDFYSLQNGNRSFTSMALFRPMHLNLATDTAAVRVSAARVTAGFFETLAIGAELGRPIAASDDQPGNDRVAVISHALWITECGGDPNVVGKTLLLNGRSYAVIGVATPGFRFPQGTDVDFSSTDMLTDVWVPWAMPPKERADHDANGGIAIARLRPGVSVAEAQAEMSAIVARLDPLHSPDSPDSLGMHGMQALVTPLSATSIGHARQSLLLLLGAVACVLLIACSNVAGLLMARAAARVREISVRSVLGAPRTRLIRQMFTESLLLACGGGTLGVLAAFGAIRVLLRLGAGNIPRIEETAVDGRVLLFSVGVSILTALLFGLLPAFSVSRSGLTEMLNSAGSKVVKGGAGRARRALIAMEVALSMILLAGSGLMIRSLIRLNAVGPGYQPHATLTMNLALDPRYDQPEKRRAVFRDLVQKTGALPGVQAVGAIDFVPLGNGESFSRFRAEGQAYDSNHFFESRSISPGYFASVGIPVLAGRDFTEDDGAGGGAPVVIISQSFAEAYFSRQGALGQHLQAVNSDGRDRPEPVVTIVGIVPDVRQETLDKPPLMQIYFPLWQGGVTSASIVVRTAIPPASMAGQIRSVLRAIDPALALADVHTMDDLVSSAKAGRRFQTLLLSLFAGIALFLSLLGLYALLAYSVKQRTAEIGVRMALGAQRSHVLRMVLRQGLLVASVGIIVGLAASLALTRLPRGLLFDVTPNDPETLLVVTLLLIIVALAASWIPAWRATRIDPIVALRYE
jgi:predicted permease